MPDLAAELALRNARLRAWKAHGVPVLGGWLPCPVSGFAGGFYLRLSCLACVPVEAFAHAPAPGTPKAEELLASFHGWRYGWAYVFGDFEAELARRLCSHLAPLRVWNADPPEVIALIKLELLAGDPPR